MNNSVDNKSYYKYNICTFNPLIFSKRIATKFWIFQDPAFQDLPLWSNDAIYTDTFVYLSFVDRLRVLISGRISVRSQTLCENKPGRVETVSFTQPLPPSCVEPYWVDSQDPLSRQDTA